LPGFAPVQAQLNGEYLIKSLRFGAFSAAQLNIKSP
jgi:hypothetical protein